MRVLTATYNDLGISWGPAVHYLELWNEAAFAEDLQIEGYAPSWTGKSPIINPNFNLRIVNLPDLRAFRQVIWDCILAMTIARRKADLIYIRYASFHLLTLIVLRFISTPVAVEMNGLAKHDSISAGAGSIRKRLSELSERWLLKRASVVFSVTDRLLEYCKGVNPAAVHVHVDNGVSRNFFITKPKESAVIRFIYVGTFTPWDGAERIIELARQRPDLAFSMVGDGDRRAELERGAPQNVEFRGWREYSKLHEEYERCNAGIVLYEEARHAHTSLSSLKTREYIASGLPVFSTRVPGQEFIEQSGYGMLSSGNITGDIQTFVEQHETYARALAAAGPELFKKYSWASVAARTVNTLREIADKTKA